MNSHTELINRFYSAFQQKDFKTMQGCYHLQATFSDPVFRNLNAAEVKAMWEMLITSGSDLKLEFSRVNVAGEKGSCHWEAWYTFSASGNKVHNVIDAAFEFKDGLILRHSDHFDFWRWSRMALGAPGVLLGWTPLLKRKIRKTARARLSKFMNSKR
jgi:hypothetical protein